MNARKREWLWGIEKKHRVNFVGCILKWSVKDEDSLLDLAALNTKYECDEPARIHEIETRKRKKNKKIDERLLSSIFPFLSSFPIFLIYFTTIQIPTYNIHAFCVTFVFFFWVFLTFRLFFLYFKIIWAPLSFPSSI